MKRRLQHAAERVAEHGSQVTCALALVGGVLFGAATLGCGLIAWSASGAALTLQRRRELRAGCPCGAPIVDHPHLGVRCVKTARRPDQCGKRGLPSRPSADRLVSEVRRLWVTNRTGDLPFVQ